MSENSLTHVNSAEVKKENSRSRRPENNIRPTTDSPGHWIRDLHQTAGNRAVERLFRSGVIQAKPIAEQVTPMVQRQMDDKEEETVQAKPEPMPQTKRQPESEKDERIRTKSLDSNNLQMRVEDEEEEPIQAKGAVAAVPQVSPAPEARIHSLRGGGQPLDAASRAYFEPRFGADFSRVRVHTDFCASLSSRLFRAKAYATGINIVFAENQYAPGTDSGKRLLAHELTHVLQQNGSSAKRGALPKIMKWDDLTTMTITPEYAQNLTDADLEYYEQDLSIYLQNNPGDAVVAGNLAIIRQEIRNRTPTVTIVSADVTRDAIGIELGPTGVSGRFTLQLRGGGNPHTIRAGDQNGGRSYFESFSINSLATGEYTHVRGTWHVNGRDYTGELPYHIRVLGRYRHSQYNIPHENTCGGNPVNVYITDGACHFAPATLLAGFVSQVNLNGSGVSMAHGNITRENYCLHRPGAPADAAGRSFRQVNAFQGSCGGPLNNSTVARLPSHPYLGCNNRVYIHTVGVKTVTDTCPGCAQAQLDNFTTNPACRGVRDLGNFMTIKLF